MEVLNIQSFKSKVFDFEKSQDWSFAGSRPALIDFYADWCGPCRALAPVLDEVAKTFAGKLDIYKVDTEATPELAALFGVRGIPALLFIPQNGEPTMASGFVPQERLEQAVTEILGVTP